MAEENKTDNEDDFIPNLRYLCATSGSHVLRICNLLLRIW